MVVCVGAQFVTTLFVPPCLLEGEVKFGCGEPLAWLFGEGAQYATSFVLLCLSKDEVRFGMHYAHAMR
jgi:hypothetical protein